MDVFDSFVQALDDFDGALESAVFGAKRFGWRRTERQVLAERRTGVNLHLHNNTTSAIQVVLISLFRVHYYPFVLQHGAHVREEGSWRSAASAVGQKVLVDQQRLHGVASRRIVALGVPDLWHKESRYQIKRLV